MGQHINLSSRKISRERRRRTCGLACRLRLGSTSKLFDPLLVIVVESIGVLVSEHVEEPDPLLGLFRQDMAARVRGSDDPTMISRRASLVAVDHRLSRKPVVGLVFRHHKAHRKSNRHPAVSGSECQYSRRHAAHR